MTIITKPFRFVTDMFKFSPKIIRLLNIVDKLLVAYF